MELWAKRVKIRWHARIWLKIPIWIARWRPYNFRTHFKCSWNDTRLSNLQKLELALSNAPALTWSQAASEYDMKSWTVYLEWKAAFQAAYALDHEIPISKLAPDMILKNLPVNMNNLFRVKSCFLSRLCIASWNFYLKIAPMPTNIECHRENFTSWLPSLPASISIAKRAISRALFAQPGSKLSEALDS